MDIIELTSELALPVAECHIACWRAAYGGIVPDHLLAAFDVSHLATRWERGIGTDRTMVAIADSAVLGFASVTTDSELTALYVRESHYGSGIAEALLHAAIGSEPCELWVFEQYPRARAFYDRHGFVADGARRLDPFSGVTEIRMVRGRQDMVRK